MATDLLHAQNLNEWLAPKGFAIVWPDTFENSEFPIALQVPRHHGTITQPLCTSVCHTISPCRSHLLSYLVAGVHGAASAQVILTQQLFLTNQPCCNGQLGSSQVASCIKAKMYLLFPSSYILTTLERSLTYLNHLGMSPFLFLAWCVP